MDKLRLRITGMSCGHCVAAVRRALEAAPGVAPGKVEVGAADLDYDPARITPAELLRRIGEAGYTAEVI